MVSRSQNTKQPKTYNCVSQREHFNYLRNNSCGVSATFAWGDSQAGIQDQQIDIQAGNDWQQEEYQVDQARQNRRVSFTDGNEVRGQSVPQRIQANSARNVLHETKKRVDRSVDKSTFERKSKIAKDEEGQKEAALVRRQKVQNYIAEQVPFSRGLTNSKFQQYYGKAAPECYGRANTNEPIGGIIYGNHLKTFNVNPHAYTNNPQNYQTHTTAINYGKRTKINEQQRWKKLERELTKKLGLKEKNETLKEGKEVNYVDVDDTNMYKAMRENLQFQKANREQIHKKELEFKKQKQQEHIDDINEFYAKKQELISSGVSGKNNEAMTAGSDMDGEEYEARLNQQNIYRHHDKNGNVRLGADRHALTCFIDLNFPQNDALYTEELRNRMPIYPVKAEQEDRNIDEIRRQNFYKSKEQPYPSHYLLRNCQEPEVLKMLSEKTGVSVAGGKKTGGQNQRHQLKNSIKNPANKNMNKSFATTNANSNNNNNRTMEESFQPQMHENMAANKSEMLKQAWGNSQLAGDISAGVNQGSCCKSEHLPHNEKNPQCYRNTNLGMKKIPFAG